MEGFISFRVYRAPGNDAKVLGAAHYIFHTIKEAYFRVSKFSSTRKPDLEIELSSRAIFDPKKKTQFCFLAWRFDTISSLGNKGPFSTRSVGRHINLELEPGLLSIQFSRFGDFDANEMREKQLEILIPETIKGSTSSRK